MSKIQNRRAVAPVIATLLLVAIAVVGGSIVLIFSQGFFSSAQMSGMPAIDALKISGYDARDNSLRQIHDGLLTDNGGTITDGAPSSLIERGERIAIYVTNNGASQVTLDEVRFGGTVMAYETNSVLEDYAADAWLDYGEYTILTASNPTDFADVSQEPTPVLEAGQEATILLESDSNIPNGRDVQIKLTTTSGAIFIGTISIGQQNG